MIDENNNKAGDLLALVPTKSDTAQRQSAFRRRQREAGLRQVTIWMNAEAWNLGFAAGAAGAPATPISPGAADALSWFGGWIEGESRRKKLGL